MDSATLPVDAVIINSRLVDRARRSADLAAENRAMLELARYLSDNPKELLQKLSEIALHLCGAGSAGVSILEEHNEVFRWYGAAGEYAKLRWGTLPQSFSPCGTVLARAAPQLMSHPERYFTYLVEIEPAVVEVLLIPFRVDEKIVGTVWVVSHTPARGFDSEDVRIVSNLTAFAAAGFKTLQIQDGLQAAIRSRDEFLAILGHELRNPLSPITTAHSLLSTSSLQGEQRAAINVIGRQLAHMRRLIDDILDASRIAGGKIAVIKRPVDLAQLIHATVESIRWRSDKAALLLSVEMPDEPVFIDADPDRIMQILGNLLVNAVKFTPPKGRIELTVKLIDEHVRIAVTDTGIGLAPENLNAIFTMFHQVDGLPAGRGGLGIGLNLAKTLTELHGGAITVHSAGLGQGCEFAVRFPVIPAMPLLSEGQADSAQAAFPQSAPPPMEPAKETAALRILVVDDNEDSADSLGLLLSALGHQAQVIYKGSETVARASAWLPHVIFHDLDLPEVDGYAVIERLRSNAATRHCVAVALTGYASESDHRRSRETGFDVHLVKPIDFDKLTRLLAAITVYDGVERRTSAAEFQGVERRRIHYAAGLGALR